MYLPSKTCFNKNFLQGVLRGDKALLKLSKVKFVNAPHYDELAVKHIAHQLKDDVPFNRYFPDKLPKGRTMDRTYFWNILNTVRPDYAADLIKFAHEQRHSVNGAKMQNQVIEVNEEWHEKLLALPFISCKKFFAHFAFREKGTHSSSPEEIFEACTSNSETESDLAPYHLRRIQAGAGAEEESAQGPPL